MSKYDIVAAVRISISSTNSLHAQYTHYYPWAIDYIKALYPISIKIRETININTTALRILRHASFETLDIDNYNF